MTHICVGNLTIIGSDNGLSPGRCQAIIETNAGILSIGPLGTNFNENSIEIHTFSFKKMHLKMSSAKWRPFCLGLNVLISGRSLCFNATEVLLIEKIRQLNVATFVLVTEYLPKSYMTLFATQEPITRNQLETSKCVCSAVAAGALALKHQVFSIHRAE